MIFAPRTHLQVLTTESVDGITIVTLKPTTYQNVCTVEVEFVLCHALVDLSWDWNERTSSCNRLRHASVLV